MHGLPRGCNRRLNDFLSLVLWHVWFDASREDKKPHETEPQPYPYPPGRSRPFFVRSVDKLPVDISRQSLDLSRQRPCERDDLPNGRLLQDPSPSIQDNGRGWQIVLLLERKLFPAEGDWICGRRPPVPEPKDDHQLQLRATIRPCPWPVPALSLIHI